jgi:Transposase DDE domain
MFQSTRGRMGDQVESLRRQFAQVPGLPFADVLDADTIERTLPCERVARRECVYTPLTTVRLLLAQSIDPDPSLRQAVSRLLAERAAEGVRAISADTGAFSQARSRLPEGVLSELTRRVGHELHRQAPVAWLWKGRDVKIVDGTTVSMPDTPDNQAAYPQPSHERPGLGFPLARVVVMFSLAVGTVLDAAFGPFAGKMTGETALFRSMHHRLQPGDVVLSDRYFCSYFELALLQQRGVDAVVRLHQRRPVDFRTGQRLGKDDHVVVWHKPKRPIWMDEAAYAALPDTLAVREVRLRGTRPGFRTQSIVVATTLRDPRHVRRVDLLNLYRMRWHGELDLRSLKQTMQMSILRSKSPDMVCKEIWSHLLAYNLIRTVMAQAAQEHQVVPRELSFKGALQTLLAFAPHVLGSRSTNLSAFAQQIRVAIASHRVADRPDRFEPRARKRRYDNFLHLQYPRAEAKARLRRGVCD